MEESRLLVFTLIWLSSSETISRNRTCEKWNLWGRLYILCSENNKFSYGFSSLRGKRASMEDFHDTKIEKRDGTVVGLFGVFDG